ncbi:MAG: DUF2442 domain-containing protein [Hungatella hathewayi]|nr:DUF2442 domain-containing protein [Hungatella hathewayi]
MIPKIKMVEAMDNYLLHVSFDDGKQVFYDMKEDMENIKSYQDLKNIYGLFQQPQLDESRTCVFWTDEIDLPSDMIYEYGIEQV